MGETAALNDAEQRLILAGVGCDAALEPGMGAATGIDDVVLRRRIGRALVEGHGHIRPEGHLDLGGMFRGHVDGASIAGVSEHHPTVIDLVQVPQAEHLKAAGVGEHRAVPAHEPVQATGRRHDLLPRLQVQVVSVREHHLGSRAPQLIRADALDGGQGSHRHEAWCVHRPMRGLKGAAPC